MKSAYETCQEIPIEGRPVYGVRDDGIPNKKVNVDLYAKDYQLFWKTKERLLWVIVIICAIYFLAVLWT